MLRASGYADVADLRDRNEDEYYRRVDIGRVEIWPDLADDDVIDDE